MTAPILANAHTPEGAVRLYLMYLQDPSKLRDEAEIKKLQQAVEGSADPIDKLKAIASLERAEAVDPEPFIQAFVAYAKQWADENDVSVAAFRQMGVPADVLLDAGFQTARGPGSRTAVPSTGGARRKRAAAVPADTIREFIVSRTDPFTIQDVREGVGGSTATVTKVIKDLVADGALTDRGPAVNHTGRGRAPTVYEIAP